jgi:hypothetical protein
MRVSLTLASLAVFCFAFAPLPFPRAKKPAAPSARVTALMEGYRTEIPPAEGMGEQNGRSVKELQPYLMSHLAGVAKRMGVRTRAECLALMPYLKDRDFKLRFIAQQALEGATGAHPHGLNVQCFIDTGSEGHRKMVARFDELIGMLDP